MFTYICFIFMVNVGKYTSPMDGMGSWLDWSHGRKGVWRNASIPQMYPYTYSSSYISYMFICTPCIFPYVRLLYLIWYVIHICLTLLHILWGKYFFPFQVGMFEKVATSYNPCVWLPAWASFSSFGENWPNKNTEVLKEMVRPRICRIRGPVLFVFVWS